MRDQRLHILILDDHPKDYNSFRMRYGDMHEIVLKPDPTAGIAEAHQDKWDIILVDLDFGNGYEEGLTEVLPQVVDRVKGHCPILVVTSDTRRETQQLVLQAGAGGIVLKAEWYDELLLVKIRDAIKAHQPKPVESRLGESVKPSADRQSSRAENFSGSPLPFISASPALQELKIQLETAVNYPDVPVLILGETGVGKDVAAHYLHWAKGARSARMEIVNLSALNKELVFSELFGHVKGSFTNATSDKEGYLEKAGHGVLFFDEIGEVSHDIQVQLLRAIENRTFQRVGETRERKLNAHLVFATNKDLEEAVRNREIREDFFQRISAFPLTIPPLRERKEDILPLAKHFFDKFMRPNHPLTGKTLEEVFTREALEKINEYHWPGNVRELRNTIQRLLIEAESKKKQYIDLYLLPDRFIATTPPSIPVKETESPSEIFGLGIPAHWSMDKRTAYAELEGIEAALIKEGGRKLEAAQRLGWKNDQTLRYKVKKYHKLYPELFEAFETIKKVYKPK